MSRAASEAEGGQRCWHISAMLFVLLLMRESLLTISIEDAPLGRDTEPGMGCANGAEIRAIDSSVCYMMSSGPR